MTATTKNAPGACCNRPEGNDNNPNPQEGAEVMTTLSQTTDERIDAALEPDIIIQDEGSGIRLFIATISEALEVYVIREEQDTSNGVVRTPWTVTMRPTSPVVVNTEGDFESPAAARNLASALAYAAQVADRLQEAGR